MLKSWLHISSFILSSIEKEHNSAKIIELLVYQRWDEKEAESIVNYVVIKYLNYQITEMLMNSSEPEEDKKAIKDMFKIEGYSPELIEKAFDPDGVETVKKKPGK